MSIAQRLYEGIDVGQDGPEGLITYMRTDSVRIEPQAIETARQFILQQYGKEYLPQEPISYSTKNLLKMLTKQFVQQTQNMPLRKLNNT